jgi:C4-dicarboxylate-specific signal transduction histidine kinase
MGQLTASIAHEVNQPIGAILITTGTALRWLGSEPPELERVTKAIERIAADSTRAGEIISRIRSLVKKGPEQIHSLDINDLISGVIGLAKSEMADDLPRVWGDQVQLQQVMLNLIINAIEAGFSLR